MLSGVLNSKVAVEAARSDACPFVLSSRLSAAHGALGFAAWLVQEISLPLLRHAQTLFPYSVANNSPCRNNSDKNLANYLESAPNPRTFATSSYLIMVYS